MGVDTAELCYARRCCMTSVALARRNKGWVQTLMLMPLHPAKGTIQTKASSRADRIVETSLRNRR